MSGGAFRTALATAVVAVGVGACAGPAASPAPESAISSAAPSRSPSPTARATPSARPTETAVASPTTLTSQGLRDAVTLPDIREHLEALQRIADENGGTRATGTAGFDASVAYVERQLQAAGYEVERQLFIAGGMSSTSLLVDTGGAGDEVVMFGAHVDSVAVGPGINDNGSGVATLVAIAQRLAELPSPERTLRFAFWGAEEGGPFGSAAYLGQLNDGERSRIGAYVNLDMIGSPNFIRFVYAEPGAAPGSEALTALFAEHFEGEGLAWEPIDLTGHADHGPFVAAGIPTGGLFAGGSEPKTDAQAAAFGGTAGADADPCSHLSCDTIANLSDVALDQMSDAVAHAVATLAQSFTD
ncbi:MAG: M20/M25/M40 family metallo-hydrolase [Candidatus Limnocylindria bacterium]